MNWRIRLLAALARLLRVPAILGQIEPDDPRIHERLYQQAISQRFDAGRAAGLYEQPAAEFPPDQTSAPVGCPQKRPFTSSP